MLHSRAEGSACCSSCYLAVEGQRPASAMLPRQALQL